MSTDLTWSVMWTTASPSPSITWCGTSAGFTESDALSAKSGLMTASAEHPVSARAFATTPLTKTSTTVSFPFLTLVLP